MTELVSGVIDPFSVTELFAGIGGFGLAFERVGFHVTDQVEIDPYCLAVLKKRFPDARQHTDVRQVGSHNLPRPTILCGGFPCQPHSVAGKRKGSEDSRDLWLEFARLVGELRPRWVVAENVPAVRSSDGGWYFWRVLADLAACGYDAEWDCVPASAVGANHQRDRIWIVAHPASVGKRESANQAGSISVGGEAWNESCDGREHVADSTSPRCDGGERKEQHFQRPSLQTTRPGDGGKLVSASQSNGREQRRPEPTGIKGRSCPAGGGGSVADAKYSGRQGGNQTRERAAPALPPSETVGVPEHPYPHIFSPERLAVARSECHHWAVEPDVGRVADGVPRRVDRLRALGNSLVPQVAEVIARRILEIEIGAD